MKYIFCLVLLFTQSCQDSREKVYVVDEGELVGLWKADEISVSHAKKIGVDPLKFYSTIELRGNGSFEVKNFPTRDPYRIDDFSGAWIVDPGDLTPTGRPMLNIQGNRIDLIRVSNKLVLNYMVDGEYEYFLLFKKMNK
jgi:hypothetical protein